MFKKRTQLFAAHGKTKKKNIFDFECYLHSKHENKVNTEMCKNLISTNFFAQV